MNVAPVPSRAVVSLIESDGGAFLSTIVPAPWASSTLASVGPERLTLSVSFASSSESPVIATSIVLAVSPGANVRAPLPAV